MCGGGGWRRMVPAPRAPGQGAPSLFCEHKKLRSTCMLCGASRAGPPPARAPAKHDVDDTWHALRLECFRRARKLVERGREGAWTERAYYEIYEKPDRKAVVLSEEEDPSTYRGAFYLAFVKLFDVTIETRRIQGYNALSDWDEMRDFVFRAHAPDALPALLEDGRLRIHGGNAAWPRQQIATELVRRPILQRVVEAVAFGETGEPPERAGDDDILARLREAERLAQEDGVTIGTLGFASKILHVFAPDRWPASTNRTSPEVAERLGFTVPEVHTPEEYLVFSEAMRAFAKSKGYADLDRSDIDLSNAFEEMQAEEGDDEELPPLDE